MTRSKLERKASTTCSATAVTRSTTSTEDNQGKAVKNMYETSKSKAVNRGRILFLVSLLVIAALLSTLSYYVIRQSETELALAQFDAISDRALDEAFLIGDKKRLGTITLASIAGNTNPRIEDWPFVTIGGYEDQTTKLIATSNGREMGFAPLVRPDQLEDFEEFIYNYYYVDRDPPFENTTAVNEFGRGIWGAGEDGKYHVTDGTTTYGSPHEIVTPLIQHNEGPHPALLINLHFEKTRGDAIDSIIDCSNQKRVENTDVECGAITDMLILTSQETEPGPGALLMQPIYPSKNPTVLAGIIASSIVWDEVLFNVFSAEVTGLDCVLTTETQVYTYCIKSGRVASSVEGDTHNPEYDEYAKQIRLTGDGLFSTSSANYTLTLYPTDLYFDAYRTGNPGTAAFGAAMIIFVTSLLFFLYDFYVRREFHSKIELLKAKRMFVRFVSHEVRTPLNSVCMGLSLMVEEIGSALGLESEDGPIHGERKLNETTCTEWKDLAGEILHNAQSAVDVLNDLLNYDKIEMGKLSLELTVIPIWALIEHTVAEFKVTASSKHIRLHMNFEPSPSDAESVPEIGHKYKYLPKSFTETKVAGDAVRITQVLRNLISNALKFTNEGGDINIEAIMISNDNKDGENTKTKTFMLKNGTEMEVPIGGMVEVRVTDSGAGLSQEQLSKLFQDGVQFNVNDLQSGQGSGLGLYIAKGIVEQHGGTLSADSEGLGKGTTFILTLPLVLVPDVKALANKSCNTDKDSYERSEQSQKMNARQIKSMYQKILVVDDVATNRRLLHRLLKNHGHTITEAEDGLDAIEKMNHAIANGKPFDTILMDNEMPKMNGPDACREMRRLGCDAFVVGVTGNLMTEDVAIFIESGANGVLPKPFRLRELDQLWHEHGVLGSPNSDTESQSDC